MIETQVQNSPRPLKKSPHNEHTNVSLSTQAVESEGKVKKKCLISFTVSLYLCNDSASPSVQAALSLLLHLQQSPAI